MNAAADSAPHLPEPLAQLVAERFRVLADPMRIRLLDELRPGSKTVKELTEATGSSQQNVSKHLRVLHGAGMVSREREGNFARYICSDPDVYELCELVCGGLRRQAAALESALAGE
jgi:DNA-binding transcriptional ArsR family regulator